MRQPKEGAGDKLKDQQQDDRALYGSGGGVVCVAYPEPTVQRRNLGKECAKARRYRTLHSARVGVYEIDIVARGVYFDRGMHVLVYGYRLHGCWECRSSAGQ